MSEHTAFMDWFRRRPVSETMAQRESRRWEFIALVNERGLHFRQREDPIIVAPRRCLIRVALWSSYDMKLLDEVADFVAHGPSGASESNAIRFEVFDIDREGASQEAFGAMVPNLLLTNVYQTPVVGFWEGGELTFSDSGYLARNFVHGILPPHRQDSTGDRGQ